LTESYDLIVEQGKQLVHNNVLPGAEEYTICFWLRLEKDWEALPDGFQADILLMHATMRTVEGEDFPVEYSLRDTGNPSSPFLLRYLWNDYAEWKM